ncbi:MAG: hypothetical protein DI576_09025 [Actinomyces sp.]|nr:MAG: hypothetical protein DI576_09025 [Actinomyces sp.]
MAGPTAAAVMRVSGRRRRPSARLEREGASADVGLSPPCRPGGSPRPGDEPISVRNTTDLGAGFDRSRRGIRPISAKGARERARVPQKA